MPTVTEGEVTGTPPPRLESLPSTVEMTPKSPQGANSPQGVLHLNIVRISTAPFMSLSKKPENEFFSVSLYDLDKSLRVLPSNNHKMDKNVDPATVLPAQYHDYLDVFSRKDSEVLPPHRSYNHTIKLLPNTAPPCGRLYGMSRDEQEELQKYLTENLEKGFIQASQSPAASPVLFVKKPGGGLHFCVNYRELNAITVKS